MPMKQQLKQYTASRYYKCAVQEDGYLSTFFSDVQASKFHKNG